MAKGRSTKLRHTVGKGRVRIQAQLSIKILKEDGCFVVYCPDLQLSSYGDTVEEAKANFETVLSVFFEEITKNDTLKEVLRECGWKEIEDKKTHRPQWVPPAYIQETTIPFAYSA